MLWLSSADIIKITLFNQKIISGTLFECQTVWIQIRYDILSDLACVRFVCNGYRRRKEIVRTYTIDCLILGCITVPNNGRVKNERQYIHAKRGDQEFPILHPHGLIQRGDRRSGPALENPMLLYVSLGLLGSPREAIGPLGP